MNDAIVHVVVDANILAAGFCPVTHKDVSVQQRSMTIVKSVCDAGWPFIRLYAPSICIAEASGVIDKYRYCTWQGELKKDPNKQLSDCDYVGILDRFNSTVKNRRIVQLEHEPDHILFSNLVSPVNAHFKLKDSSPMGSTDCVIAAIAILMKTRLACRRTILVTADSRLTSVIDKCRHLTNAEAELLRLKKVADICGIKWSPEIYPECVNLKKASDNDLVKHFLGWPLPVSQFNFRPVDDLLPEEQLHVCQIWREISAQYAFLKDNPDNLPYTLALDDFRTRLAAKHKMLMSYSDIFRRLVNWRKSPSSWPDGQGTASSTDEPSLFA